LKISLIVAQSENGVIGRDGALPWHLPRDLKRFRKLTLGKPVIMGRKTRDSIGRPLDGRLNIVMSRDPTYERGEGCLVARSPDHALALARANLNETGQDEVFVIGGESVFLEFAPLCSRIYLTTVRAVVPGDAHFPETILAHPDWSSTHREDFAADERNAAPQSFEILER
jgi:dihydrofolate reductase